MAGARIPALLSRLCLAGVAALVIWQALAQGFPPATSGDGTSAQPRAQIQAALARSPADGRLLRALAGLAGIDSEAGQTYLRQALRLRPADVQTRAWLADGALARNDIAAAAAHLDAILRVAPQRATQLFPLLQDWLRRDGGVAAVTTVFAAAPPWRRGFFASAPAAPHEASLQAMARLLLALRRSAAPANLDEGAVVIDRLLQQGEYERGWLLWLALQAPGARTGPQLSNGDFEQPGPGRGFDWVLRSGGGASATLRPAPQRDSQALRVRFDPRPLQGASVAQTLLLAPGGYRLRGEFLAGRLAQGDALEWRIDCLAPRASRVAATALPVAAAGWTPFQLEFHIPAQDCRAQRLQLQASLPGARLSGDAWFDNLGLEALTATAAAPGPVEVSPH
jgi:hypothetical protein